MKERGQDKEGNGSKDERSDKVDRGGGQKETWEENVLSPSPKSGVQTIQGMGVTMFFSIVNPQEIKPTKARKGENRCCVVYILVFSQVCWYGGTELFQKANVKLPILGLCQRRACQSNISNSLSCRCVPGRFLGRD